MKRKICVVIADSDERVGRQFADYVAKRGNMEVLKICRDGQDVYNTVLEKKPDVVLMDLILPKMDGLTVLELLHQAKNQTPVIVTSILDHSELIHCACTLGAAYYVCKPYQLEVVYQRMCQIAGWYTPAVWVPQAQTEVAASDMTPDWHSSLESELTAVIRQLGIPAHIKGYQYIRESVLLALEDDNMLSYITKYLYPTIAKRHRTTSSSVERAIRHAIVIVWERGNAQAFEEWYGTQECRPTNSEFLSLLVDKFRLEHQDECAQYINRQASM